MNARDGLAEALRLARKAKGLSQEDFSNVSSRTYLSTLERGLKSPTLEKLLKISEVLELHPLTLLTLAFTVSENRTVSEILTQVASEAEVIARFRQ